MADNIMAQLYSEEDLRIFEKRRKFGEEHRDLEIRKEMLHIEDSDRFAAISWLAADWFVIPLLKTWDIDYIVYGKEDITPDMPQSCISGFRQQPNYVVIRSRVRPEDLTLIQDLSHIHEFRKKMWAAFRDDLRPKPAEIRIYDPDPDDEVPDNTFSGIDFDDDDLFSPSTELSLDELDVPLSDRYRRPCGTRQF